MTAVFDSNVMQKASGESAPSAHCDLFNFLQGDRPEEIMKRILRATALLELGISEMSRISRPFGTDPLRTSHPALKRRAIVICPCGTDMTPVISNPRGIAFSAACLA